MKFGVGDLVSRKKEQQDSWWTSRMAKHNLPPNRPLVIMGIEDDSEIIFKEHPGSWSPNYFDLVEKPKYKLEDFL